jgi:hypothetical protein
MELKEINLFNYLQETEEAVKSDSDTLLWAIVPQNCLAVNPNREFKNPNNLPTLNYNGETEGFFVLHRNDLAYALIHKRLSDFTPFCFNYLVAKLKEKFNLDCHINVNDIIVGIDEKVGCFQSSSKVGNYYISLMFFAIENSADIVKECSCKKICDKKPSCLKRYNINASDIKGIVEDYVKEVQ